MLDRDGWRTGNRDLPIDSRHVRFRAFVFKRFRSALQDWCKVVSSSGHPFPTAFQPLLEPFPRDSGLLWESIRLGIERAKLLSSRLQGRRDSRHARKRGNLTTPRALSLYSHIRETPSSAAA